MDNVVANSLTRKAAGQTPTKSGGQATALPFRSYQTGTLHTNNFEPSGSTSTKGAVDAKNRLSAKSAEFVPSTQIARSFSEPSANAPKMTHLLSTRPAYKPYVDLAVDTAYVETGPLHPSLPMGFTSRVLPGGKIAPPDTPIHISSYDTRIDLSKKDVVFTNSSVTHNAIHMMEYCRPGEKPFSVPTDYYHPYLYNFDEANDLASTDERIEFWSQNWVEIILDMGNLSDYLRENGEFREPYPGIVRQITHLGHELPAHAQVVFVTINFPEETSPRVPSQVKTCTKEQMESLGYKAVQIIADKLKEFSALTRLEVILRTPAHTQPPISLEQLNHALPFYELPFTNWRLKWQNSYMGRPETISGWPITYLDIERSKINRDNEKARREKENKVFVHPSASPAVHDLPFNPRIESSKPSPKGKGKALEWGP